MDMQENHFLGLEIQTLEFDKKLLGNCSKHNELHILFYLLGLYRLSCPIPKRILGMCLRYINDQLYSNDSQQPPNPIQTNPLSHDIYSDSTTNPRPLIVLSICIRLRLSLVVRYTWFALCHMKYQE